jgi:hypothetical protein
MPPLGERVIPLGPAGTPFGAINDCEIAPCDTAIGRRQATFPGRPSLYQTPVASLAAGLLCPR